MTSGELAKTIFLNRTLPFATPHHKYWLFNGDHPRYSSHQTLFQGTLYCETKDIHEADFIYVSIPHIHGEDQTDPEVFRQEIQQLKSSRLPMVCSNPDCFAHEGNPPRAVVRQGGIAALYEEMGGQVFYIGKPYASAYTSAMKYFCNQNIANPAEVLMIGDTPETDIRGARLFGMSSALVTQTGFMAERISQLGIETALHTLPAEDRPDYYIKSLYQSCS